MVGDLRIVSHSFNRGIGSMLMPIPDKVTVQFLMRIARTPREQWPIIREETMTLQKYLDLPMAVLADTKVALVNT